MPLHRFVIVINHLRHSVSLRGPTTSVYFSTPTTSAVSTSPRRPPGSQVKGRRARCLGRFDRDTLRRLPAPVPRPAARPGSPGAKQSSRKIANVHGLRPQPGRFAQRGLRGARSQRAQRKLPMLATRGLPNACKNNFCFGLPSTSSPLCRDSARRWHSRSACGGQYNRPSWAPARGVLRSYRSRAARRHPSRRPSQTKPPECGRRVWPRPGGGQADHGGAGIGVADHRHQQPRLDLLIREAQHAAARCGNLVFGWWKTA
jgi:hypothetical protein